MSRQAGVRNHRENIGSEPLVYARSSVFPALVAENDSAIQEPGMLRYLSSRGGHYVDGAGGSVAFPKPEFTIRRNPRQAL